MAPLAYRVTSVARDRAALLRASTDDAARAAIFGPPFAMALDRGHLAA